MAAGNTILSSTLKMVFGAVTAIGGSYIASKINEKKSAEERLERLEMIVETINVEEQSGKQAKKGK